MTKGERKKMGWVPRDLESATDWVIQGRKYSFTHFFSLYLFFACYRPGLLSGAGYIPVNETDQSP